MEERKKKAVLKRERVREDGKSEGSRTGGTRSNQETPDRSEP